MQSEACGATVGYMVVVGGRVARVFREGAGFAFRFAERDLPTFRAHGLPSQVLALAEEHIRKLRRTGF